jgi:hypothetical protein
MCGHPDNGSRGQRKGCPWCPGLGNGFSHHTIMPSLPREPVAARARSVGVPPASSGILSAAARTNMQRNSVPAVQTARLPPTPSPSRTTQRLLHHRSSHHDDRQLPPNDPRRRLSTDPLPHRDHRNRWPLNSANAVLILASMVHKICHTNPQVQVRCPLKPRAPRSVRAPRSSRWRLTRDFLVLMKVPASPCDRSSINDLVKGCKHRGYERHSYPSGSRSPTAGISARRRARYDRGRVQESVVSVEVC